MWYNQIIVKSTTRRIALGAVAAALAAGPAAAQEPRLPTMAVPSGAAAAARLGQIFDQSPTLRALPDGMVTAPRMSERVAPPPPTDARPRAARLHQDLVVPVPVETPAYSHTFKVLLSHPEKTDRWDDLIYKYARRYHLDARFLKSIMAAESEFDPKAVSPAGARGLMQVMPVTAQGEGVNPRRLNDPEQGIKAGAAYIQTLFKAAWRLFHLEGVRYTDVPHWVMQRVIAAYHAGPKFLTRKRWFASTRAYVRKVVLYYHSNVTDLRRPSSADDRGLPAFSEAVAPGGTLY